MKYHIERSDIEALNGEYANLTLLKKALYQEFGAVFSPVFFEGDTYDNERIQLNIPDGDHGDMQVEFYLTTY